MGEVDRARGARLDRTVAIKVLNSDHRASSSHAHFRLWLRVHESRALALRGGAKLPSILHGGDGYLKIPLLFDPGTRWEYGISVDWLRKLVEKVSGQPLEAYFRANILGPLDMKDTFYNVPPDKQTRLASLYQRRPDGSLEFTRALLTGSRLLKPETAFSSLLSDFAADGAVLPGGLDKFGLSFALNTRALEKGRGANTMSWAGIFNTFFWIDRDKNICAVLMSQMSPGLEDGPRTLLGEFDRAVYRWRE
jgi:CubicO group peptidase (beta-lactamase class C family)